jgi:hypothetical protein
MNEWGGQAFSEGSLPPSQQFSRTDGIADVLDGISSIIAGVTGATTVLIAQRNAKRGNIEVKGRYGTLVNEVDMTFVLPELNPVTAPTLAVPDLRSDPRFASHPLLRLMPHSKSMIAMLVPGCPHAERAVLKIINPRRSVFADAAIWRELSKFCEVIESILCLRALVTSELAGLNQQQIINVINDTSKQSKMIAEAKEQIDSPQKLPCVSFLFDTLVKKRVLHSRNGIDFITMRTWRGPMKPYQLAALVTLKQGKPNELVRRVASELATAAVNMHGEGNLNCVVPVPGGNSGDTQSFSVLVATEVAALLNIPCEDLLLSPNKPAKPGKSTPRKSANLKPFNVTRGVDGPILVVDDVVSSGKHMEMAISALRQQANAVYGIAWIGK